MKKKNIKLNEVETFTHLKVKILVKSVPNVGKPSFFILSASSSPTCLVFRVDPSWSELIRPGLAVRVDPVRLLYLPIW